MIHPVKDAHPLASDTATDTSKSPAFKFLAPTSCKWHTFHKITITIADVDIFVTKQK
jgi:hypothetical protein